MVLKKLIGRQQQNTTKHKKSRNYKSPKPIGFWQLKNSYIYCYLSYLLRNNIPQVLISRQGLAQCTELCLQLRGQADKRQVPDAKLALQHNLGLGGAVVVALYKMGFASDDK